MTIQRADIQAETSTYDPDDIKARLSKLEAEMIDIKRRVTSVESVHESLDDIRDIALKIWRAIKFGAPSVITAAVTAGYLNGDFGNFLRAVLN